MGLRFLSACLPKLILVASNWKAHPLIRNSSPQSRVFRCLPSWRDSNTQVSWVFSFRFCQPPFLSLLFFSFINTLGHSEMAFLRLWDSHNSKSGQKWTIPSCQFIESIHILLQQLSLNIYYVLGPVLRAWLGWLVLCFLAVLRYDGQTIKCMYLKCTIWWVLT